MEEENNGAEEQNYLGSTSSNGGNDRPLKKAKEQKAPQRGLGVAQLEKLRIEEELKNNNPTKILLPPPSSSLYFSNQSLSSPISFRPPLKADQLMNPGNDVGYEIGLGPVVGHRNAPKFLNTDYNFERGYLNFDPGLRFPARFPYQSYAYQYLPSGGLQKNQQYQQPCSSMMNVSSASSLSSVLNFQTEPPSNQRYIYGNTPEEDKMVGMKRPYPFSQELPPHPPSSNISHFPGPINKSDEPPAPTDNFDPSKRSFRESHGCPASMSDPSFKDNNKTRVLNGDGPSLALQPIASYSRQIFYLDSNPYHEPNSSIRPQRQVYNFFPPSTFLPPSNEQISQTRPSLEKNNEEKETLDLELRL